MGVYLIASTGKLHGNTTICCVNMKLMEGTAMDLCKHTTFENIDNDVNLHYLIKSGYIKVIKEVRS